jgi:hypothetical protein
MLEINLLWIVIICVLAGVVIVWIFYSVLKNSQAPGHTTLGDLEPTKARVFLEKQPPKPEKPEVQAPYSPPMVEPRYAEADYQNLLNKALGDIAKVERLIAHEGRLNPRGSRSDWVSSAKESWDADHRRG